MEPILNFILSCITTIIETFKNIKNNNSIIQIKVKTLFYKLFVMFDFGTPLNHEEKKASKYSELFNQSGEKARMLYRSKVYLLRQKKLTQEQLFNNYLTFLKNTIKEKSNDDVDITDIGSLVTVAEQQIFTDQNINHIISMIRKHLKDAAKLFANENYDMLINRATVIFIKNNFDDQCSLMQNLNRLPLLSGNEVLIFKILLFVRIKMLHVAIKAKAMSKWRTLSFNKKYSKEYFIRQMEKIEKFPSMLKVDDSILIAMNQFYYDRLGKIKMIMAFGVDDNIKKKLQVFINDINMEIYKLTSLQGNIFKKSIIRRDMDYLGEINQNIKIALREFKVLQGLKEDRSSVKRNCSCVEQLKTILGLQRQVMQFKDIASEATLTCWYNDVRNRSEIDKSILTAESQLPVPFSYRGPLGLFI